LGSELEWALVLVSGSASGSELAWVLASAWVLESV